MRNSSCYSNSNLPASFGNHCLFGCNMNANCLGTAMPRRRPNFVVAMGVWLAAVNAVRSQRSRPSEFYFKDNFLIDTLKRLCTSTSRGEMGFIPYSL